MPMPDANSEVSDMLLTEQRSVFNGAYPDIPNRRDFVLDSGDSDPLFMTLPIGKAGTVSGNGKLYDREFYVELVRQVNEAAAPISGHVGHPNPDAQDWEVKLPSLEWVGATLDADGMAWGKAYIYPEETKLRRTVLRAKARRREVATSIYGQAQMDGNRATKPTIKRIDFADPERAGVKAAVAVPATMSEMTDNKDTTMSENQLISELQSSYANALKQVAELQAAAKVAEAPLALLVELKANLKTEDIKARIAELQATTALVAELRTLVGGEDVKKLVSEMVQERDMLRRRSLAYAARDVVNEQVKLPDARPLIAEMIGLNWADIEKSQLVLADRAAIETTVKAKLEDKTVQEMLKGLALLKSGGRAFVGEGENGHIKLDTSPEAMAAARAIYGIS